VERDGSGMQEGLSAGITHGAEGRKLIDVATYNPSAKVDYLSALKCLKSVNFSLIAELKANKDASVETIMNLLRLEDALAEKLDLVESQPHVDQLMKIKENISNHVSALRGVFVPLSEPLSAMDLEGTEGTSGAAPDTTTALSVTSISGSTIPPISTDDYKVVHTDGQEGTGGETVADESVVPYPNVSDTELDVLECDLLCVDHFAKYYYPLHTTVMREAFPDGILYASSDSHYFIFKSARMYRMDCEKVNTLISGEIDCEDFKAKLYLHKDKPAIINVNIDAGIGAMLNERPQDEKFTRKWQLACQGNIAHVVVKPNINIHKLDDFVNELIERRKVCYENGKLKSPCVASQIR
nr:putative serine decarboxylase [Tanacetum cinerariifolium]